LWPEVPSAGFTPISAGPDALPPPRDPELNGPQAASASEPAPRPTTWNSCRRLTPGPVSPRVVRGPAVPVPCRPLFGMDIIVAASVAVGSVTHRHDPATCHPM